MKEILIISGKGGAGKTSLCAAFAVLAGNSVLVDCDVDASDLHLLLKPDVRETHGRRLAGRTGHHAQLHLTAQGGGALLNPV